MKEKRRNRNKEHNKQSRTLNRQSGPSIPFACGVRTHSALYAQHSFIVLNQTYRHTYETIERDQHKYCAMLLIILLNNANWLYLRYLLSSRHRPYATLSIFFSVLFVWNCDRIKHTDTMGLFKMTGALVSPKRKQIRILFFLVRASRWDDRQNALGKSISTLPHSENNGISPTLNYVALILISFLSSSAIFMLNALIACKVFIWKKRRKNQSKNSDDDGRQWCQPFYQLRFDFDTC